MSCVLSSFGGSQVDMSLPGMVHGNVLYNTAILCII